MPTPSYSVDLTGQDRDVECLLSSLPPLPEPVARPVLVVVVGLPGSGKSHFSRRLSEKFPLLVLEIDALRSALFGQPTHSQEESARLFRVVHRLIARLLKGNIPVLVDATNLVESHREVLYSIAEHQGAKLVLVWVEAPEEVVKQRLARREVDRDPQDRSKADWRVYQRMRDGVEPIRRDHYAVDTTRDIAPVIEKVVRELNRWLRTSRTPT